MSKAFEKATGSLAEKMLIALEAAQKAGGDIRGRTICCNLSRWR